MAYYRAKLPDLIISSGFASSNLLPVGDDATSITIIGPSALTSSVTVRVATDSTTATASAVLADLTSGGSDVTIAAGDAVTINPSAWRSVLLVSGSAEAAQRTFKVIKTFRT